MKKSLGHVAIIGATGYIGSHLTKRLITRDSSLYRTLTLISRNPPLVSKRGRVRFISCDHLHSGKLQEILNNADTIYHLAGLAWQHPGSQHGQGVNLLVEELLQNTVSAHLIARNIMLRQNLIWVSTSAVELLLKRVEDDPFFFQEVCAMIDSLHSIALIAQKSAVGKSVIDHIVHSLSAAVLYSYPYSKYLAEQLLLRENKGNIKILRLSDVYGEGQPVEQEILDPQNPARRVQRFIASYLAIRDRYTSWIPLQGETVHGFYKTKRNKIVQKIWNDWIYPTYIEDATSFLIRAGLLEANGNPVFALTSPRVANREMAQILQKLLKLHIPLISTKTDSLPLKTPKADFVRLGIMQEQLTPFEKGVRQWLTRYSI